MKRKSATPDRTSVAWQVVLDDFDALASGGIVVQDPRGLDWGAVLLFGKGGCEVLCAG